MPIEIVSLVLLGSAVAVPAESAFANPRSAAKAYVVAALAGHVDAAQRLAIPGRAASDKDQLRDFSTLIDSQAVLLPLDWMSEQQGRAIAVNEQVKTTQANPDGRKTGILVFTVVQSKGKWLVDDIDFDTVPRAKQQVDRFRQQHPDAKLVPIKRTACSGLQGASREPNR